MSVKECMRARVRVGGNVSACECVPDCVCGGGGETVMSQYVSMCSMACVIMCVTVYPCEGSRAFDTVCQFSFPCPLLTYLEPLRKKIMRSKSQGSGSPTLPGHRGQGAGLGSGRGAERREAGEDRGCISWAVPELSLELSFSSRVLSHFSHLSGPERPRSCSSFPQSKRFPEKERTYLH